jgi:Zn-dependent protease with chaperone function
MTDGSSIARRAVIALLLTIGFYFLAITIALGTIVLPFIVAYFTGHVILKLVIVCVIAGGTILIAIIPRRDKFEPPGPLLKPEQNPRLFEIIEDTAAATEQEMPGFVYLLADYNAFVAQRGGAGQFGGKRIMGIGLPLMKVMNTSQFKAVIAHEFGHYYHGDTKLGPWIYNTRAAIVRTVVELEEKGSILQMPFKWYGQIFLSITQAISRQQEFNADRLSAKITGKSAAESALKSLAGQATAFQAFMHNEFLPVVGSGYLPPFLGGLELFMQSREVQDKTSEIARKELSEGKTDKYDTHPSLSERIEAIKGLDFPDQPIDNSPAIGLLDDPAEAERKLFRAVINESHYAGLKPIEWDNVLKSVYLPTWRKLTEKYADFLGQINIKDFAAIASNPRNQLENLTRYMSTKLNPLNAEKIMMEFNAAIGAGLVMSLLQKDWKITARIGDSVKLYSGENVIHPFNILIELGRKEISKEQWEGICNKAGITDMTLGPQMDQDP